MRMHVATGQNSPVSGGYGLRINRRAHWTWILAALCAFLGPHLQSPTVLFAQQPQPAPNRPQPAPDAEQMVKIDFTEDIELRALVDFVSSRLTINILNSPPGKNYYSDTSRDSPKKPARSAPERFAHEGSCAG